MIISRKVLTDEMEQRTILDRQTDSLSHENTNCLKGIFAVIVVLSHIRGTTTSINGTIIGMLLTAAGYLSVGFFFFISGYGLSYQSIQKGKQYIAEFPFKRILNFYIKYLVLTVIYACVKIIYSGSVCDVLSWKNIIMLEINIENGWYLQAIMIVYLLFYFVWKLPSVPNAVKYIVVYVAFLLIVPLKTDSISLFYQSSLCIIVGLLFPVFRDKVKSIVDKHYFVIYITIFLLFCVTVLLGNLNVFGNIITLIIKMVSAPLFVFFVLLSTKLIPVQNPVTAFLGEYSLEIYVLHGIFLNLFHSVLNIENYVLYGVAVYSCTILSALVLHLVLGVVDHFTKVIIHRRFEIN